MGDRRNRATYAALTGGRSALSEPRGWLPTIAAVVASAGSVSGAARELGVPRRTLRRWITGESTPPVGRRSQVEQAAAVLTRRARMSQRMETRLRKGTSIRITGTDRYDGQARQVTFKVGLTGATSGIKEGTASRLVDVYFAGESGIDPGAGLFDAIVSEMTDTHFYREFFGSDQPDWGVDVETVKIS